MYTLRKVRYARGLPPERTGEPMRVGVAVSAVTRWWRRRSAQRMSLDTLPGDQSGYCCYFLISQLKVRTRSGSFRLLTNLLLNIYAY